MKRFFIMLCLILVINLFGCSNQNYNSSSSLLQSGISDDSSNVTSDSIISPSSTTTDEAESNSSDDGEGKFKEQLSSFQEDLASQRGAIESANDTHNYSASDEQVWQYCQDRWKYYDNLEGGYSGDKHTNDVFQDAGTEFGISPSEAKAKWDSVDQAKVGLK